MHLFFVRPLKTQRLSTRPTAAFLAIIADEKASKGEAADHFAASGANDRIWNSLEKLCLADPENLCPLTHANRWIELASEAWLGPAFQMTAQVNLVRPGGKAQEAHCDYHLGFMTADQVQTYPAHVHRLFTPVNAAGRGCPLRHASGIRHHQVASIFSNLAAKLWPPIAILEYGNCSKKGMCSCP